MHVGKVQIEFDPAKARANVARHEISFAHAEQALFDPFAVTIEDPDAEAGQRFVTWARMLLGESSLLFMPCAWIVFD